MNTLIQISTDAGQFYYTLFYKLSFFIAFVLYIAIGIKRKYPLHNWLLLGGITALFFIVGTKLGTYSWEEWKLLFTAGHLPLTSSKSLIGGLTMGFVAIIFFKKWMNFKPSLLDAYALILPVSYAFQRIGCLLAGCCFGTTTDVPWAISYASHYSISIHHIEEGLIEPLAANSMAVHPVPIYLMLAYLFISWLSWKKRNRWTHNGSLAIFSLICLFSLSFLIEFFRDPVTNHALGDMLFGLKEIQWLLVGMSVLLGVFLFLNERFGVLNFSSSRKQPRGLLMYALLTTILVWCVWMGSSWFTKTEAIIIHSYVGLMLISFVIQLWKERRQLQPQWSTLALFVISLFFINQTYDGDKLITDNNSEKEVHSIAIGVRRADLDLEFIEKEYREDGCDNIIVRSDTILTQSAISGNINYRYENKKSDNRSNLFGIGVSYSKLDLTINNRKDQFVSSGANLFYGSDWRNLGFRAGLGIGNFTTISRETNRETSSGKHIQSRRREISLFPYLGLRLGEKDKVNLFGVFGFDQPYDPLYSRYNIGISIGLNTFDIKNKSRLELGIAQGIDQPLFRLGADLALSRHFTLQPELRFGEYPVYGIGLRYHFIKDY